MFPLHCNKCYCQRELEPLTLHFHISTCGHILCDKCRETKCPLCSRNFQAVAISKDMPSNLHINFCNPLKLLRRYQNICKFQAEQHNSFLKHCALNGRQRHAELQRKYQSYVKIHGKLRVSLEYEQKRINKLREYIEWSERRQQPHQKQRYKVDGGQDLMAMTIGDGITHLCKPYIAEECQDTQNFNSDSGIDSKK